MTAEIGKYVVYGAQGVCKIGGYETKCFDGVNEVKYCKLLPVSSGSSTFYIPEKDIEIRVRDLVTSERAEKLIDSMPNIQPLVIEDERQRKNTFSAVLKSGDHEKIISMMKLLYTEQKKRAERGKALGSADEKAMHDAENVLYQEFSQVLNIDRKDVESFITSRIEGSTVNS